MSAVIDWILADVYRVLGVLGLVLVVGLTIRYQSGGGKHRR